VRQSESSSSVIYAERDRREARESSSSPESRHRAQPPDLPPSYHHLRRREAAGGGVIERPRRVSRSGARCSVPHLLVQSGVTAHEERKSSAQPYCPREKRRRSGYARQYIRRYAIQR